MSDNPFSEPADSDRTVIRPRRGGMRPPSPASPPAVDPAAPPAISVSPLAAAASPLLELLSRLRGMRRSPDIPGLRARVGQELGTFERRARDAGVPMDQLRPAHYALCASIDDAVLNTPWGAASGWSNQTLVATFHPGASGSDQFLDRFRQMLKAPGKFLPVIELVYLCLALGFMGRPRQARGEAELERIRGEAHAAIATQRKPAEPELSRRWQGIHAPYRPGRPGLPAWVALAAAAAACGALLLWTATSLNAASGGLEARVAAVPPTHMPQITRAAAVPHQD